jgi:hypothetical protein
MNSYQLLGLLNDTLFKPAPWGNYSIDAKVLLYGIAGLNQDDDIVQDIRVITGYVEHLHDVFSRIFSCLRKLFQLVEFLAKYSADCSTVTTSDAKDDSPSMNSLVLDAEVICNILEQMAVLVSL